MERKYLSACSGLLNLKPRQNNGKCNLFESWFLVAFPDASAGNCLVCLAKKPAIGNAEDKLNARI